MSRFRLLSLLVATAAAAITSLAQTSPVNRPWPPPVQQVSIESPPLPPDEALKTFHMPPGYFLELVASEPLVRDPIAMDWDTAGRAWVVEMPAFVRDLRLPEPNLDPICRIVVLEDVDRDGRMDKRTVFADGLILPRSVKVLDRGVLVAEPPNIWLMRDQDGDLRMDTKELVATGFGRREGDVELNANSLFWGLDNSIHTAHSDLYLRLKSGKLEAHKTLSRGEWGVTQDDVGRVYRNTSESPLHIDLVPTPYYSRNPNLLRSRGSYERLGDFAELNTVWPVRPTPGTNRAYQQGITRPDGSLARFTAACSPLVYRGDRLPADLYGNIFVAEPAANLVSRIIVKETEGGPRVRKAYENAEFLSSSDERFRPVYLSNSPEGTLYIVDLYRGILQQRIDITEYLHAYIVRRKLERPIEMGRIYRVGHLTTQRDVSTPLPQATAKQLVETLTHPNGWRRDHAQQLLVERADRSIVPALVALAESETHVRTRLHALWTLDGIDAIGLATVTKAMSDPSRDVRVAAIRISERWLAESSHPAQTAVLRLLDDPEWAVRHQLAASLGVLPVGLRESSVVAVLERYGDDPVTLDAALSGIRGSEISVLERIMQSRPDRTPRSEPAISMLAATVFRGMQDAAIQRVLAWLADTHRPGWQRSALAQGAEIALLGAPMPGTAVKVRPVLGDQYAPGGKFYFPRPSPMGTPRTPIVRLIREPKELVILAAGDRELESRAVAILTRLEWPAKPGAALPVSPLSREEQQRFEEGGEIYKNICQGCHQPDGLGQERVAPSLVGSDLALAPAEVTARILLNGKEGVIGLMPPVGSALSDEKIAAVLTYIRREWGQSGSPIDPALVKDVRALTAGRPVPWKDEELRAMIPKGRFN